MATDLDSPAAATMGGEDPFAALTRELTEVDYAAGDVVDGIITYAHLDNGGILVTIDHARQEARLSRRNDDGDPTWMFRLTGDTPPAAQIITLYAVLHASIGDEKAIVRSVAEALNVPLDAV